MSERYSALSDAELISRCLEQDDQAWEALLRRFKRLVASIAFKYGLSEDTDDIFQSVGFALYQQLPHLRKQEKLSSWIITVTVRECWKLRRRLGSAKAGEREPEDLAETPDDAALRSDDLLLRIERQHLLRRGIERLSDNCRQLLELLFYQDPPPTYIEIGDRLNMPVASIGPTRGRCLEKLKGELKLLGFF